MGGQNATRFRDHVAKIEIPEPRKRPAGRAGSLSLVFLLAPLFVLSVSLSFFLTDMIFMRMTIMSLTLSLSLFICLLSTVVCA